MAAPRRPRGFPLLLLLAAALALALPRRLSFTCGRALAPGRSLEVSRQAGYDEGYDRRYDESRSYRRKPSYDEDGRLSYSRRPQPKPRDYDGYDEEYDGEEYDEEGDPYYGSELVDGMWSERPKAKIPGYNQGGGANYVDPSKGGGYSREEEMGPTELFIGKVKSYAASQGYGFIECGETFTKYKVDVFLHKNQVENGLLKQAKKGDSVRFAVTMNKAGRPQARNVEPYFGGGEETPSKTFLGRVKGFNAELGYGFIECEEVRLIYNSDIFLHKKQFEEGGLDKGCLTTFTIEVNGKGRPQARNVQKFTASSAPSSVATTAAAEGTETAAATEETGGEADDSAGEPVAAKEEVASVAEATTQEPVAATENAEAATVVEGKEEAAKEEKATPEASS